MLPNPGHQQGHSPRARRRPRTPPPRPGRQGGREGVREAGTPRGGLGALAGPAGREGLGFAPSSTWVPHRVAAGVGPGDTCVGFNAGGERQHPSPRPHSGGWKDPQSPALEPPPWPHCASGRRRSAGPARPAAPAGGAPEGRRRTRLPAEEGPLGGSRARFCSQHRCPAAVPGCGPSAGTRRFSRPPNGSAASGGGRVCSPVNHASPPGLPFMSERGGAGDGSVRFWVGPGRHLPRRE